MYILAYLGADITVLPSVTSAIGISSSGIEVWYPYEVGIMALGVSSPAYPARNDDEPISITSADTSSDSNYERRVKICIILVKDKKSYLPRS